MWDTCNDAGGWGEGVVCHGLVPSHHTMWDTCNDAGVGVREWFPTG